MHKDIRFFIRLKSSKPLVLSSINIRNKGRLTRIVNETKRILNKWNQDVDRKK